MWDIMSTLGVFSTFREGGGGGRGKNIMSTSVHWKLTMMHVGDIMVHVGIIINTSRNVQYLRVFKIKTFAS